MKVPTSPVQEAHIVECLPLTSRIKQTVCWRRQLQWSSTTNSLVAMISKKKKGNIGNISQHGLGGIRVPSSTLSSFLLHPPRFNCVIVSPRPSTSPYYINLCCLTRECKTCLYAINAVASPVCGL